MKYYILYICVVIISAVTRTCSTFSSNEFEIPPAISSPIVDTLSHVYDSAHSAAVDLRLTDFVDLADTGFWNRLEVLSRRYGFNSVQSYLGQQAFYWPDIDTLVITEIRESGDYARLTGMGAGRQSWQYPARIHYREKPARLLRVCRHLLRDGTSAGTAFPARILTPFSASLKTECCLVVFEGWPYISSFKRSTLWPGQLMNSAKSARR